MKDLHERLMESNEAYERWHHHPAHRVVHWLALTSVAALAAYVFMINVGIGLGQDAPPAPELPPITPASSGRVVGVSPDHVLVKFKPAADRARKDAVLSRHGLKAKSEIRQLGVHLLTIGVGADPEAVARRLNDEEKDDVAFAEADAIIAPGFMPNDPWFANWQKDKQQIDAPTAWDAVTGSGDQIVAVVDTGVDCAHEDLGTNCLAGWNFYGNDADASDVYGHGTKVAGVVAAVGNNGTGVAGGVWQSKIMPLRVSAPDGTAALSTIANAVVYAADHGAKVVNNSYQSGGSQTVIGAAQYLKGKGGLLVVSEGNYGADTGYAAAPDVISVSGADGSDVLYSWSSFGDDVDVAAPGCTGATTVNHGGYANFCGTSNAAPEVAGTLMLIWAANPSLTPDQARDILFSSAKDLGTTGWDPYFGWGRIDAAAAVALARQGSGGSPPPPPPEPSPSLTILSYQVEAKSATSATVTWTTDKPSTGTVSYGLTAGLNLSAADTSLGTSHVIILNGLKKNTRYYYAIRAVDAGGQEALTPTANFRTRAK